MERFHSLLLSVWREACQHIEIAASVARIASVLLERLPFETMLVRRLDGGRSCVETVATGVHAGAKPPEHTRSDCAPAELERIV